MSDSALAEFVGKWLSPGQQRIADLGRRLVDQRRPDQLARLPFEDDNVFLEPFLFAQLSAVEPTVPIEQVLFRHLNRAHPGDPVPVRSDRDGVVYLPAVGYVFSGRAETQFELRATAPRAFELCAAGARSTCECAESWTAAGGAIEVLQRPHSLLARLFVDRSGVAAEVDVADVARAKRGRLSAAFDLLAACHPAWDVHIRAATRTVTIFRSAALNSFAAFQAHGMAFCNAGEDDAEAFFVEDLAHQCGHIIFTAVTSAVEPLAVPRDTPLSSVTGRADDRRSVYEALHGVFTEGVMTECLSEGCARDAFAGTQRNEARARLAFIVKRFGYDLGHLSRDGLFTDEGERLYGILATIFRRAYDAHAGWVQRLDFSNQGYNFDFGRFMAVNDECVPHSNIA